jgi:hypothetical protein
MPKALLVATFLAALAPAGSFAALEEELATETVSEAIEDALKPVRDQITNMQVKIERRVVSAASPDDPDAPRVTGWAATCCVRNLIALHKSIPSLDARAARVAQALRGAGREDGVDLAVELALDTRVLARYLEQFAAAPTEAEARTILSQVVVATMNLNVGQRKLAQCCADFPVPKQAKQ